MFDPASLEHIRWNGRIRPLDDAVYDQLPEAKKLRELVKKSFIVPAWLAKLESPEALALSVGVSQSEFTLNKDDEDLSFDVHESLPFILHIPRHASALQSHLMVEPMEADRRHPIDTLGSLVWDLQSDKNIIYRLVHHTKKEQQRAYVNLALSGSWQFRASLSKKGKQNQKTPAKFNRMLAHSFLSRMMTRRSQKQQRRPCHVFSTGLNHHYALHWVTEFKRDYDELISKCQVIEGLVSALYQRRALGFPNHFVFGTAHYSRTTLEVLAATWVPSDELAESGARSQERAGPGDQDVSENPSPEADTASSTLKTGEEVKIENPIAPGDGAGDPSENSPRGDDARSSKPKTGEKTVDADINLSIKEIKKYNKIVIYSIAKYDMTATQDILQLYLLMRQTLVLAQQYRNEMIEDSVGLINQLINEAGEFYEWPPPPHPKSDRGTKRPRTGSECSNPFGPTPENDSMSVDPCDDSNCESDREELESPDVDGPKRRVVGEG
ncbi:hypothetical protein RSOLAG22IIIB_07818 [Rhizoctonia solani]|uniref:Uncharacterized protein n=1 Tax=Rhizoctonia solani TaxID=456999 RepID=A0A0K6FPU5_9AGAM|nr:hypothetical protein RSOLAG22IIIB_07818 [Rhizoctonia solani]